MRFRTRFSTVNPSLGAEHKGILMSMLNLILPTPTAWSKTGTRAIVGCLAAMMIVSAFGCSTIRSFDESAALTYRDFVWSKRAYNLRYGNCDRPYGDHFRNGFCAGYADICQGGDGFVPALPPDDYRSYEYQSADGSKCVNAWFEGYPAGVAAAKQDKSGSYHDVMISRMIDAAVKQDQTSSKLPSDVSVVNGQAKRADSAMTVQPSNAPMPISPINPMPSVVSPVDANAPQPFNVPAMAPIVPANFKLPESNMSTRSGDWSR